MKKIGIILFLIIIGMLSGCEKKENYTAEEIYRKGFSQYLLEALELEKYDKMLAESEMHYIPNAADHMTDAQIADCLGLTYIYLRNDIHTERLTQDDTDLLMKEDISKGFSSTAMDIIKRTYPDVISAKAIEKPEDKEIQTSYDSTLSSDFVTVDSLVLVIGTMSEFDKNGNYVDQDHEKEKNEELEKFCEQIEKDLNGKLGDVPIRVLFEK